MPIGKEYRSGQTDGQVFKKKKKGQRSAVSISTGCRKTKNMKGGANWLRRNIGSLRGIRRANWKRINIDKPLVTKISQYEKEKTSKMMKSVNQL